VFVWFECETERFSFVVDFLNLQLPVVAFLFGVCEMLVRMVACVCVGFVFGQVVHVV